MNTLAIFGIVIAGILFLALVLFLVMRWRGRGDKVTFMLHTRDMRSASILYARVKINEKGIQQYFFKNNQTRLPLRPPTRYVNNKPVRDITYDIKGDLTYIENFSIQEDKNIKIVLSHEERLVTLNRLEENQNRYKSTVNKWQAMTLIAIVILFILSMIGIGYMGYNLYNTTKKINENSKEMIEIASANQKTTNALQEIAIQQTAIMGQLVNNRNLTRQIS